MLAKYIWIFPVLFVFHDLEEIIGFGIWGKKNMPKLEQRVPKLAHIYKKIFTSYSTEGMALAVLEILVLCIIVCLLAMYLNLYQLWVGVFIVFIFHLLMHILQAVIWHGYIPAVITSIIVMPVSIIIAVNCIKALNYAPSTVILWSVIGLVIAIINVKFAHALMHWFTQTISQ